MIRTNKLLNTLKKLISLYALSLCFSLNSYEMPLPAKEKYANQSINQACKIINKEKKLYAIGTGGEMLDEVNALCLTFEGYQEIGLEEARELIVYCVSTFLNIINSNQQLQPYLGNYPFTSQNVEIMIFLYKPDRQEVGPDNISLVRSMKGLVEYHYGYPLYKISEPFLRESYQEACDKLALEKKKPPIP